jgi:hypothetical protein
MEESTTSVKENIYSSAKSLEQVSSELKIEVNKFEVSDHLTSDDTEVSDDKIEEES